MRSPGGFTSFLPTDPYRNIINVTKNSETQKLLDSGFTMEQLSPGSTELVDSVLGFSSPTGSSSKNTVSPSKLGSLKSILDDKLFGSSLSGSSSGVTGNDSTSSNPMISDELDVNKGAYSEYLQDFIDAWNEANAVSKENWQLASDWNEEMYNTRYQRTVEDLKRAGVNPLLISSALSSQSSPTVGSPSSISPTLPSVPYSTTGSSEISGLFNLYSTLIKADTDTQIAILQDLTNNRSISQREAKMWIEGIGGLLKSVIGVF